MVAFLIVAAFLDKIELEKEGREEKKEGLSFHLLLDSLKHIWRSDYQKLLVPLTIYSGIEQAFIAGDFTRVSSNCCEHTVELQWLEHRWLVYHDCFELVLESLGKKIHSCRHYHIWDNLV